MLSVLHFTTQPAGACPPPWALWHYWGGQSLHAVHGGSRTSTSTSPSSSSSHSLTNIALAAPEKEAAIAAEP